MKPSERAEIFTDICRMVWGLSGTFDEIFEELEHHGEVAGWGLHGCNWIDICMVKYGEVFNLRCWLTGANFCGNTEIYWVQDLDDPD